MKKDPDASKKLSLNKVTISKLDIKNLNGELQANAKTKSVKCNTGSICIGHCKTK